MPRRKEFDENEVLEKAKVLFWKQGFHATSIQDLVDHCGINRASLYATFHDKSELFEKAFLKYKQENQNYLIGLMNIEGTIKDKIRHLFTESMHVSAIDQEGKGCFLVNTSTELLPEKEKLRQELINNQSKFEFLLNFHLDRAAEKGELKHGLDHKAIAHAFFALYNGLKVLAKIDPNEGKIASAIEASLRMLD
ncbi:MAG: TetR/AcrR family transcriptional regulator [Bacteroidota bacterium]